MNHETDKTRGKTMHEMWSKKTTLQDKQLNKTIYPSKWSSFECSRNYLHWYLETPTSPNQNLSRNHDTSGKLDPSIPPDVSRRYAPFWNGASRGVKLLKLTYPGHPWNQVTSGHGKKHWEPRQKSLQQNGTTAASRAAKLRVFFNLEAKLPGFVPLRDCELLARNPRAKKNACGLGTCVKYYMSLRIDSLLFSCPTCANFLPFWRLRLISSNKSNCSANVCGYFPLTFHFSWCHFLHACLACFSRLARFVQCILSSFCFFHSKSTSKFTALTALTRLKIHSCHWSSCFVFPKWALVKVV